MFSWIKGKTKEKEALSEDKINELLPHGSVVVLKDGEKKLMVIGMLQANDGGKGENFDYVSVMYPEGYMGDEHRYLFNHDDIAEVIFRGYEDSERTELLRSIRL